jgi:hypothetical protein
VRSKWMIVNYLTAIGVATAGWLYFIVWVAMLLI